MQQIPQYQLVNRSVSTDTPVSIGQTLEGVSEFQYLGSIIFTNTDVEVDIRARIGKAASTFQRLLKMFIGWKCIKIIYFNINRKLHSIVPYFSHSINLDNKLRLYTSIVIPTALHACETWKSTSIIRQKLDVFHQRCLRTILGISWRDHITNDEVLWRVDLGTLSEIVRQRRLRFAGHILRLPENRPAYMAMNWQPGRLTKTWRTTFNEDLHDTGLTWMGAKRSASDKPKWRKLVARCSSRNWRN